MVNLLVSVGMHFSIRTTRASCLGTPRRTGLDLEAEAYRRLRGRLIEITRPVINFLNDLDAEKDLDEPDKVLSAAVSKASSVPLERLPERSTFIYKPPPRRGPTLARISYQRPKAEAEALREALSAQNNKEIGEKSFDYAYSNLVEEE